MMAEPGNLRTDFLDASSLGVSPAIIEEYAATAGKVRSVATGLSHARPALTPTARQRLGCRDRSETVSRTRASWPNVKLSRSLPISSEIWAVSNRVEVNSGTLVTRSRLPQAPPLERGASVRRQAPLKPQQVWAVRSWLNQHRRLRDRALFDTAIDSKLRGLEVAKVRRADIAVGGRIRDHALVVQRHTKRPVQFELVEPARKA